MSQSTEIERKFLVARLPPDLDAHPSETIAQGYLAIDGRAEVRVRRRGGRTALTVESGAGRVRVEEEMEIDERRFDALWPLTEGRRLTKTRHQIPAGPGLTFELDVYAGALEGLVTVEVEFASEADGDAFEPPAWVGREVTGDRRYANQALATAGMPL